MSNVVRWFAARLGYIGFGAAGACAILMALDAHYQASLAFAGMAFISEAMAFLMDDPPR